MYLNKICNNDYGGSMDCCKRGVTCCIEIMIDIVLSHVKENRDKHGKILRCCYLYT